ncbi:MAG: DMT family transporter [Alphaproteobacteria bacterium]
MRTLSAAPPNLWPSLGIVVASVGWGLFWLPLRAIEAGGVSGPWATLAVFLPGALALVPVAAWRHGRLRRIGPTFLVTGLFSGGAWVLYANSLLYTEVVRALLLFYLTPLWSTLLARAVLGEPITVARLVTIVMGIGGLVVILGLEGGFPVPRNVGDWLGLASGMIWAGASVRLRREPAIPTIDGVFAYFLGGAAISFVTAMVAGPPPGATAIGESAVALVVVSVGFILPSMILIIWGARRLSPGRVGILLMVEAVVGAASAALLTDEPFGAREAIGSVLIISAGVVDVLWTAPAAPAPDRA